MAEATIKQNTPKLVTAYARSLRIAPRKMRLLTNLVKNLPVEQAITQLHFANKKAAPMVIKLLKSAVANAEHNFSLKAEDLYIKSITCDMGTVMKRYFPRARGSAFTIRRKMSHVNVTLEERKGKAKKKRAGLSLKATEKSTATKTTVTAQQVGSTGPAQKTGAPQAKEVKPLKTEEQVKENLVQNKRRPTEE
jgi:large subunit ribosomal protein L22